MSKLVRYIAVVLILLMFVTVTSCRKNSADSEPGFVDTTEDESEIGDTDDTKDSDSNYEESANGADNGNASQKQAYYAEDEDGNVVSTVLDQYIDKEYHLNSEYSTTGDYYVSEKDQGLAKSERRATEQSKYDFDKTMTGCRIKRRFLHLILTIRALSAPVQNCRRCAVIHSRFLRPITLLHGLIAAKTASLLTNGNGLSF